LIPANFYLAEPHLRDHILGDTKCHFNVMGTQGIEVVTSLAFALNTDGFATRSAARRAAIVDMSHL